MSNERYLMIPVHCLESALFTVAVVGLLFGVLAFLKPLVPLRFYQWTMSLIHWRVEPENEKVELRNTRIMGALMIPLSGIIFFITSTLVSPLLALISY